MLYILLFLILLALTLMLEFNNDRKIVGDKNLYNILLVLFILLAGFRWKVGGDTLAYMNFYNQFAPTLGGLTTYDFSAHKFEPLFVVLMSICKTFSSEFWLFQLVHAIIINTIIFSFLKKHTPFKYFALLIYFFFYYFYLNTEILRESLAICVFLIIYEKINNKKYIAYYLGCLIAIAFHSSAIILLFFPFLARFRFNFKTLLVLSIIGFLFTQFIANISTFLALIPGQASLASRFELYSGLKLNINGMIFTFALFVILPYFLHVFNKRNSNPLELFSNLELSYFIIAILFVNISGLGRLMNYFSIFLIVYFSNTICYLIKTKRHFLFLDYRLAAFFMILISFSYKSSYYLKDTSEVLEGTRKMHMYYPYSSIFNKDDFYVDREFLYYRVMEEDFEKAFDRMTN